LTCFREFFGNISIPQAAFEEVVVAGSAYPAAACVRRAVTSWVSVCAVGNIAEVDRLRHADLDLGESEAIVLATELASEALLMDDAAGVKLATAARANVI
jgi:predicted nucleic acid-binding protein